MYPNVVAAHVPKTARVALPTLMLLSWVASAYGQNPMLPTREYIRGNGRVLAIHENSAPVAAGLTPASGSGATGTP
jgi:hypothetical protein